MSPVDLRGSGDDLNDITQEIEESKSPGGGNEKIVMVLKDTIATQDTRTTIYPPEPQEP